MDKNLSAALSTIETYCDTPRAHSALKTLRNELSGASPKERPNMRDTPGGRQSGAARTPGKAFDRAGMVGGKA